jgi:flagellar basal-body rod protein FlgC
MAREDRKTFVEDEHHRLARGRRSADLVRVYSSSVSGLNAADFLLAATADNIANSDTGGYQPWQVTMTAQPGGGVSAGAAKGQPGGEDLVDDMASLITGSVLYKANARAFSVAADTEQSLFDAIA